MWCWPRAPVPPPRPRRCPPPACPCPWWRWPSPGSPAWSLSMRRWRPSPRPRGWGWTRRSASGTERGSSSYYRDKDSDKCVEKWRHMKNVGNILVRRAGVSIEPVLCPRPPLSVHLKQLICNYFISLFFSLFIFWKCVSSKIQFWKLCKECIFVPSLNSNQKMLQQTYL